MAEIKKLQVDGADIYPVTHESAVYDSEGKSIEFKYLSSVPYTEGDDISIDTSEFEVRLDEVEETANWCKAAIGDGDALLTTNKNTIVDAINEVFQCGNNVKEGLVEALIAKGVEASTSESFEFLINKVREISGGGLNIISATSLPATGEDNQICVIMDSPIDSFKVTSNLDDVSSSYVTIGLAETGVSIPITAGNTLTEYTINFICYNGNPSEAYYWSNNQWNQLSEESIFFLQNKVFANTDFHGGFMTNIGILYNSLYGLYSSTNTTTGLRCISSFNSPIDFSRFSKIRFKGYKSTSNNTDIYFINSKVLVSMVDADTYISNANCSNYVACTMSITSTTYELDISNWDTVGYLAIQLAQDYSSISYITDIELV